jgi:Iap family predicted aminopeptidase
MAMNNASVEELANLLALNMENSIFIVLAKSDHILYKRWGYPSLTIQKKAKAKCFYYFRYRALWV